MDVTLGKRIATHRKEMGMTQDQLAEKLGITAQAVSKWENDLSCPDITVLPKLADIFGTTTDALLGREASMPVCETVVVEEAKEANGFTFNNGKMDFHWEGAKLEGISLACWVLLTGIIYLISQLTSIDVSFWNVMWPSFLLTFGLFGLYPKFSAFRLGCGLLGGYFLLSYLHILKLHLDKGIVIAAAVLLFGLALLADALKKHKHPKFTASYTDKFGKVHHGNPDHSYNAEEDHFTYDANFGNSTQLVVLDHLRFGEIDTNFGEYTVDLRAVAAVDTGCKVTADCSFGNLTILVPKRFQVIPDSSTSFAGFELIGQPDVSSQGTIRLRADVSFGQITVQYI